MTDEERDEGLLRRGVSWLHGVVALIVIVSALGGAAWGSAARVERGEWRMQRQEAELADLKRRDDAIGGLSVRMARVEAKLDALREEVGRMRR
ncbi:MAG TPA: hypothetical protein VLH79_16325 [Chthonomonadales bacterium]|nr:hypothetical protein [Chthonomonadales bacterium]